MAGMHVIRRGVDGGECKYGRSDCSYVVSTVSGNSMMNVICSFLFVNT